MTSSRLVCFTVVTSFICAIMPILRLLEGLNSHWPGEIGLGQNGRRGGCNGEDQQDGSVHASDGAPRT